VKFSVVSRHLPEPEGTAAGRILLATCEGLLSEGHDVEVWSWGPEAPTAELPSWCTWRPLPGEHWIRTRLRAFVRPRQDVVRARWKPSPDVVAVGDDPVSFPAVARSVRSVLTIHYSTRLDARAAGRTRPRDIQSMRGEAAAARRAALTLAYSPRVADAVGRGVFVPAAWPFPVEPLVPAASPVAVLLANWDWSPNRAALAYLLAAWPEVRSRVPHARLLLAGRGDLRSQIAASDGVEILGTLARSSDVLARAALVAYPCLDDSGPKMKVFEAMGYGIPVVTTPAGVEGLVLAPGSGAVVVPPERFASAVADLLLDPERRLALGTSGREALRRSHAPVPAARARIQAIRASFG
jgi:glycosyltransferase involved in cell wall biosynthesis